MKIFSVFTGIGSPEMAIRNIGIKYDVVGISEVDKYAILAYDAIHNDKPFETNKSYSDMLIEMKKDNIAYNFSTGVSEMPKTKKDIELLYKAHKRSKNFGDIRLIDINTIPDFDLFTYSFPCKNISIAGGQAGLQKGSGTQSSLLWECDRIIKAKKPKYLLLENVKNLVGTSHIKNFLIWIETLNSYGYNSTWKVMNACDFGVPQNRERVIMVSVLKEIPNPLPIGIRTKKSIDDIAVPHSEVSQNLLYKNGDIEYFRDSEEKGKLNHIGYTSRKKHSNSRVYNSVGYSPTLNSMNGGNRQPKIKFKDVERRLSALECWRLMGYKDDDYQKAKNVISNSKLYERAGRGIVVPMLEEIFKKLLTKQ